MPRNRAAVAWSVTLTLGVAGLVSGTGVAASSASPAERSRTGVARPLAESSDAAVPADNSTSGTAPAPATDAGASTSATPTTEPSATPTPTECPLCPPDNYTPADGAIFNHPFSKKSKYVIRRHIIRTIRSVPAGGSIRIAAFSVNDDKAVNALIAARDRGVSVQVLADWHLNIANDPGYSPSFQRLKRALGTQKYGQNGISDDRASFAAVCVHACRGASGNLHNKLYLFSSAGNAQWVTMNGSANITLMAVAGQWNHNVTYSDQATYNFYQQVFEEMRQDTPRAAKVETTNRVQTWVWPRPSTDARDDPMMDVLNRVRCTGATGGTGRNGRTVIRIGMYSWYKDRGLWLAKKVRSLWNKGCNIAIEYAITNKATKSILYSPAGRGRIPMKQVGVYKTDGTVLKYTHHKFIAISGNYGGDSSTYVTFAGTTNWSDLGRFSDEMTQRWYGAAIYHDFARDWSRVWKEKYARTPSPVSTGGGTEARIGEGNLRNLTTD